MSSVMLLPRTNNRLMVCERGHTHLIVFTHACDYYSRAATISLAELQVRLLFEGGYYSGCGFYSIYSNCEYSGKPITVPVRYCLKNVAGIPLSFLFMYSVRIAQ